MKVKYVVILVLIVLLGIIVSRMLKFEDALRKKQIVEVIVGNEDKPIIEELSDEILIKTALSSEYKFIAQGDYFSALTTRISGEQYLKSFEQIFLKGVNLGVALPDRFPSEFAVSYEMYLKWMIMLGNMNANTIRVYTILPPEFYKALAWYNLHFDNKKLYLLQGIWAKEPPDDNYSDPGYTKNFMKEIADGLDVIHGNAVIPPVYGHADGVYSYDVSDYTIGIILGREWEPYAVTKTNKLDSIETTYGLFIDVLNPSPMEKWIAGIMEFTARYETQKYRKQRPLSFVNWLPLDPMYHNSEYIESDEIREFDNDLESVDMEKFSTTNYFKPGIFASYHVYPYYPDFIFQERKYRNTKNHNGQYDNYLAYLLDLKGHQQGMPLVIAEYGVPSSRGNSHYTQFGYHQGGYSEKEQAEISVLMTEDIHLSGCAGALFFEWIDEWFKNNWLVMDFEQPQERRKKWHNMENPEQNYGIIAMETRKIEIDGSPADWKKTLTKPFIAADSDPAYFYISAYMPDVNFQKHNLYIAIDTYDKNLGSFRLPFKYQKLGYGVEFLIEIKDKENAEVLVDQNYDIFTDRAKLIVPGHRTVKNEDGIFIPQFLLSNRARTDILGDTFPETKHPRGKLIFGNSCNPESSNADFIWNEQGFLELRLTWQLLNVTDPSSRSVLMANSEGDIDVAETNSFRLLFIITDKNKKVLNIFPAGKKHVFQWEKWETPMYSSRIKPVYYSLAEIFKNIKPLKAEQIHSIPAKHSFSICDFYHGNKGAVSIAMDGRCYSQFMNALPVLKKYRLKATVSKSEYLKTMSGATQYRKMLDEEFEIISKEGHEVRDNEMWLVENSHSPLMSVLPWKSAYPYTLLQRDSIPHIREIYQQLLDGYGRWTIFMVRHILDPDTREYENLIHLAGKDVPNISEKYFERFIRVCRNSGYWIAPMKIISNYLNIRDKSKVIVTQNGNSFFVQITNSLSIAENMLPVTIEYTGPAKTLKVSKNAAPGVYNVRGGKLFIDVLPNIQTTIEILE